MNTEEKISFADALHSMIMPSMSSMRSGLPSSPPESELSHLDRLVRLIFSKDYLPGQRLVERDLAAKLNLSRIPIREGLLMLAAKGLVLKDDTSRGMRLRDYSPMEVLHLYEYREAIELTAIQNACQNRTRTQLVKLDLLCDELEAESVRSDASSRLELDWQFHQNIVAAGGNKRFINDFALLMIECNYVFYHLPGGRRSEAENKPEALASLIRTVADEHREIVRLIDSRDGTAAAKAMRAHLSILSSRVHRSLVERQFRKTRTSATAVVSEA